MALKCSVLVIFTILAFYAVADDDSFAQLGAKELEWQSKLSRSFPTLSDDFKIKKLLFEMKKFVHNIKIVLEKINTGVRKLRGVEQKKARRAARVVSKSARQLEDVVRRAGKRRRGLYRSDRVQQLLASSRGAVSYTGEGIREFIEAVKDSSRGSEIIADVQHAYLQIGEMLVSGLSSIV